jgi:hypothetical protein
MAIWEGELTKDVVTASDFPLYLQVKVTWNGGSRPNGRLTIDSPNHMHHRHP